MTVAVTHSPLGGSIQRVVAALKEQYTMAGLPGYVQFHNGEQYPGSRERKRDCLGRLRGIDGGEPAKL